MTPHEFLSKWRNVELKERTASQSHFNDLCRLLGVDDPIAADPKGEWFTFEKGATKTSGGEGWADVWRKGCFAWEYKGRAANLGKAFDQLLRYSIALESPPLLIVSDMERIRVHTNWTNTVQQVHEIALEDLADAGKRDLLRACFDDPERLRPTKTRQMLTEEAAQEFAALAQRLRERGHEAHAVAHFVNRLVFCMFAEDVDLLPNKMFQRMLEASHSAPAQFTSHARTLFAAMKSGGMVGFEKVEWFNGGLFDDDSVIPLEQADINNLLTAAKLFWDEIDPSILGTLFERGLDPDKRSQLGAHYTDRNKIMMIVRPVIIEPLEREWADAKERITTLIENAPVQTKEKLLRGKDLAARTKAFNDATAIHRAFLDRLRNFRVLDPACGSGNFLNLSLLALKDIEHRANLEAEQLGLPREFPRVGPENVLGIELNPYAAELARVSVWIGEIQWMRRNGFDASRNPILRTLGNIEQRNAIVNADGTASLWPDAEAILGNPPYLGAKLMKRKLGTDETAAIRSVYEGRLPGFTDLVCYWFENARSKIEAGLAKRAGFVATNSIRKNTNLPVMHRVVATTRVFDAWPEQKWTIEGAAVDVSLVCFGESEQPTRLNGAEVDSINPDLTTGLNLTLAGPLRQNADGAFLGIQKSGPFDVPGKIARQWLLEPSNPNGKTNNTVLKPYWNGDDVTGRPRDYWFIDLPLGLSEGNAAIFSSAFHHIATTPDADGKTVKQLREELAERAGPRWWEPHWPRAEMRSRIASVDRYIVTPETAQHRLFVWLRLPVLPDKNLIVIPRDDDTTFGILHSRMHELWSLRKGSDLQDRPRYTHTSTFATFPFPRGLTPDIPATDYANDPRAQAIAVAAARLNELRENWLNPSDLVGREPEVVPSYPDRILPVDEAAAKELDRRTLTNLYNARPAWLDHAHRVLDGAVAEAYGWGDDFRAGLLSDDEILVRLFRLNQERATAQ
ncbi:class I SAM-dependent DNA methyltransferase [Sphingopyxis sp. SE2]|uniref:class I SAM-dependent DNA methyltransferase n=1 Tax=Sphingopyxis sp. SE2 TaxID=1586240 RepID=UPI0028BFD32F|nr:DNA methyltransferase [Sphingopyxis sp. SE2]MDT7529853.1 class I SAM-dependent DNA methyltransferase [Sphingopyxis sp. SE2]